MLLGETFIIHLSFIPQVSHSGDIVTRSMYREPEAYVIRCTFHLLLSVSCLYRPHIPLLVGICKHDRNMKSHNAIVMQNYHAVFLIY